MESVLSFSVIKIALAGTSGFLVAFLFAPSLLSFLVRHKLWRKEVRTKALGGGALPVFQKFHTEGETSVPRLGGLLVWLVPPFIAFLFFLFEKVDIWPTGSFNFLSRSQTWLPVATLLAASFVGFIDDILQVIVTPSHKILKRLWPLMEKYGAGSPAQAGGLSLRYRLSLIGLIAMTGAWWFYEKLGWSTLHIPGGGDIQLGWLYIPIFFIVMIATYSGGIIDGLDGLAGGTFASMFAAYAVIAFAQHQIDLAAFCITLVGTILAFLWFNIPPARFYMGEAGMMGLTATLTVVAFLTDSVLVLPIIAFPLVLESGSVIIQSISKKFFKRKVFLATPIHHHFEALGWPHYQITMRFWIIGIVMAIAGIAIRLLG